MMIALPPIEEARQRLMEFAAHDRTYPGLANDVRALLTTTSPPMTPSPAKGEIEELIARLDRALTRDVPHPDHPEVLVREASKALTTLLSALASSEREREGMRRALEPFADLAEHFDDWAEDDIILLANNIGTFQDGCTLVVWDFRAALNPTQEPTDG